MMSERRSRLAMFVCVVIVACGGGGGSQSEPETPGSASADTSSDVQSFGEEDAPAPPADPCASGTCTPCGDAVCLSGFYCEEAVSACGWLPECADAPSCECLEHSLPDCSCEERGGGVYVACP